MSIDVEIAEPTLDIPHHDVAREPYEPYRALCTSAIVSLALAVLSPFVFIDFWLGLIPAMSILLAIAAEWQIRRNPAELTGAWLSRCALVASALVWASGASWLTYVYVTEVPDGYLRVSYSQLQPLEEGQVIPPAALELNGMRVFIKGYALQSTQQKGLKEFILVRDRGQCCFGGNPSLTDQIMVKLAEPLRLDWSTQVQRLAGVFRVEPVVANGEVILVYHLDADYLK